MSCTRRAFRLDAPFHGDEGQGQMLDQMIQAHPKWMSSRSAREARACRPASRSTPAKHDLWRPERQAHLHQRRHSERRTAPGRGALLPRTGMHRGAALERQARSGHRHPARHDRDGRDQDWLAHRAAVPDQADHQDAERFAEQPRVQPGDQDCIFFCQAKILGFLAKVIGIRCHIVFQGDLGCRFND